MPNRFQINQHDIAYRFIAARDGEYCLICQKKPPLSRLQIDHADNNPDNWDPDNLHLVCRQDNIKLRGMSLAEHKKTVQYHSAKNERERACARGIESTNTVKELVDYRQGSTEMQANSYYEMQFREWLLEVLRENRVITRKEAINSGAEIVGCNPTTTARYLAKLTSSIGNLREGKDATGTVVVTFKQARAIKTNGRTNGRGRVDLSRTVEHKVENIQ